MFDLYEHRANTDIACGTYPIIDECEKENNNFANLKEKLIEYFKNKSIEAKVDVKIAKVTKKYTITNITLIFNGDEWGYAHKTINEVQNG